jgi:hypothetical protein
MSRQSFAESLNYKDPVSGALKPADLAEVFVYEAGTTKVIALYADRTSGTTVANPFVTGESGMAAFWASSGDYDIKVHDTKGPARFGDYTFGWQSSPVKTAIAAGELSGAGDLSWSQDSETGAWIPQLKADSVGAAEIAAEAVGAAELAEESVTPSRLDKSSKPVTWYAPKIIAAEESRSTASFAKLATADEIPNVVVPTNGFVRVYYRAKVKTGAASTGKASIFLGSNEVKNSLGNALVPAVFEATAFELMATNESGMVNRPAPSADVTTGQLIAPAPLDIFLAAGTYALSVQYFGTISAKERKLWVEVHGF